MNIINLVQVIVSILLIAVILLQSRGSGLGSVFGGDMGGYYTKRGFEKFLFHSSIVLATVFIAVSIASVILS